MSKFSEWLQKVTGNIKSISLNEAALGILSIMVMAFITGGITAIYKNEKR